MLHARIRAERNASEAADSAWRALQESISQKVEDVSRSLGLASFALGSRPVKSFGLGSMALKSRGVDSMAEAAAAADHLCDDIISLGGGNVVAAFRSMRKTLAKTRNSKSLPRTPGALLKCSKPPKAALAA